MGLINQIDVIQLAIRRAETDVLHVSVNKAAASTLIDRLWRDTATRRALIVACGLQATQQLSGFNLLMCVERSPGLAHRAGTIQLASCAQQASVSLRLRRCPSQTSTLPSPSCRSASSIAWGVDRCC